jgi:hypothetical protein
MTRPNVWIQREEKRAAPLCGKETKALGEGDYHSMIFGHVRPYDSSRHGRQGSKNRFSERIIMGTNPSRGNSMVKSRVWQRMVFGFACALIVTGCASVGPPTVARDRFDYVTSVSDSWKRQMLLNMLKIRYSDAPIFMDVASVINAYEVSGDVSLGGQLAEVGRGDQLLSLGASGRYSDKPTITYHPLTGDKFAKNLMNPIPISAVLFLIQSGLPADLVLRVCVNSINDIENSYNGPGR